MSDLTNEQIQAILDGAPEGIDLRHQNTNRNRTLNLTVRKLSKIVNHHNPEVDVPIALGVWDCLDCVTSELEAPLLREILTLRQEVERLKAEPPTPNEQGKNRYGLDMAYFRNVINRELNRPLVDFKPDELSRVFARLSKTADKAVMFEPEFSKSHDSEVAARAVDSVKDWFVDMSEIHNSATISETCEWAARQIEVYQVRKGEGNE